MLPRSEPEEAEGRGARERGEGLVGNHRRDGKTREERDRRPRGKFTEVSKRFRLLQWHALDNHSLLRLLQWHALEDHSLLRLVVKCDGPLLYTYLCRLHLDRRAHDGPHRFLPPLVLLGKQHEHRDYGQDDHDDVTDHLEDEANREEADPVHYLAEQDAGEDERDEVNDDEKAVAADQGARLPPG